MLLSLPAAPVKDQPGKDWHLQWRSLVAQFDEKVNSITKLLTAGTDQPGWTPRPPYVDHPPPPLVDYAYYPDLLLPKNLITLARREFERYLYHRWQARREQLKGRYPLEARFLRPDVAPAEVKEAERFIEHKINADALQRWNEDVRELRLHELAGDDKYPLPILRGDPVPELDLNKLAIRSLPRLIAQEKEITQKIQDAKSWQLLEPRDLGFVVDQLTTLAFPLEEKETGRLVLAWLKELEHDPEIADLPSSVAETVALRVSAVINRAILYEWDTFKRSADQVMGTLKLYCAQEVERFCQRFQVTRMHNQVRIVTKLSEQTVFFQGRTTGRVSESADPRVSPVCDPCRPGQARTIGGTCQVRLCRKTECLSATYFAEQPGVTVEPTWPPDDWASWPWCAKNWAGCSDRWCPTPSGGPSIPTTKCA